MLQINSNRFGFFLFILVMLLISGCASKTHFPRSNSSQNYSAQTTEPSKQRKSSFFKSLKKQPELKYATIWEHLFALYALPEIDNKRVRKEIQRYLKNPKHLQTIQTRATPYLYAIIEEIEAKNLPGELALLPVVESAFKPDAFSSSSAAGLWQFIPSTGRFFGLEQNWWYDGRQDIHTSTIVATDYLKELNETFDGDWLLALASYNAGKGTVGKAIKKNKKLNKPTDYWSLPLPDETQKYVPRLLAVAHLFAHAEDYNITLLPIPDQRVYETVDVGSQLDLAVAARLADTPMNEFINLNPGYKRWCTAPQGPHRLLIPVEKVDSFRKRLAVLADHERMIFKHQAPSSKHKVKKGDTLSSLARKYHCSVSDIRHANMLKDNNITVGKILFIPNSKQALNSYLNGKPLKKKTQKKLTYIVKKGDNLWKISRKFSVTPKHIMRWNHLSKNATLKPGQKLIIRKV